MKRRNLFMSTTLMCGFFYVAFTFDSKGIHWLSSDSIPVAFILAMAALVLLILWYRASKRMKTVLL
jgi:hypothetical protein